MQLLLIHGADVNQIDDKRQTALHHATILGYTDLACMLLKKGADHRRVNTDNKVRCRSAGEQGFDCHVHRNHGLSSTILKMVPT